MKDAICVTTHLPSLSRNLHGPVQLVLNLLWVIQSSATSHSSLLGYDSRGALFFSLFIFRRNYAVYAQNEYNVYITKRQNGIFAAISSTTTSSTQFSTEVPKHDKQLGHKIDCLLDKCCDYDMHNFIFYPWKIYLCDSLTSPLDENDLRWYRQV